MSRKNFIAQELSSLGVAIISSSIGCKVQMAIFDLLYANTSSEVSVRFAYCLYLISDTLNNRILGLRQSHPRV